jgi:hypothetical protein
VGNTLKSPGMKIRHHKERGEWAELCFMTKATEKGFKLTKPWGDNAPYDVVVDLGGRFVSVQVKCTMFRIRPRKGHDRPGCFSVRLHRGGDLPYQPSDFHYLAVYVIPKDAWYIIPFALVAVRSAIRMRPGDRENKYERYREAWHLLRKLPLTVAPGDRLVERVRWRRGTSSVIGTSARTRKRGVTSD